MADDWRARDRAVDDALRTLAPAIAEELNAMLEGGGWWADIDEPDGDRFSRPIVTVRGPGDSALRLNKADTGDVMTKVQIHGLYPQGDTIYWRKDVVDHINVGAARGAEVFAREIVRRLLPGYLPALADAQRRVANAKAAVERRHARRDRLREVLGMGRADLIDHQQSESQSQLYLNLPGSQYGSVTLTGDGSDGKLELTGVPYEHLVAYVTLLQRINFRPRAVA